MKILHLPTDVGGNSWGLASGERKLGLDSTVLVKQSSWLGYQNDIDLDWASKGKAGKLMAAVAALLKIRKEYDIFHFNFGSSLIDPAFFPLFDLPFYPRDKKVFFTYNGCDARQKYRVMETFGFSACHDPECYGGICNSGKLDELKRKKIKKMATRASGIFSVNPDLLSFLPEGAVFLPYTIATWDTISQRQYSPGKKIRIVHAPTNKAAKGSKIILEALERLKGKYKDMEVRLIDKMANKEALEVYAGADMVIDQVLIGWYGALAVEAMKMGKPVAVFIREEDLKFIPGKMASELKEAVININPSNIYEVLEKQIQDASSLINKHKAALEYVHRWHDPVNVARTAKSFYEK